MPRSQESLATRRLAPAPPHSAKPGVCARLRCLGSRLVKLVSRPHGRCLCKPCLFSQTIRKLTDYIKLCGDGTFRLIRAGWVLLNLGVLSKHYTRVSGTYAFRSTFSPLAFAIANKECQATYTALFRGAVTCAKSFIDLDLPPRVFQYHCDWHPGENLARLAVFPNSARAADFSHFIGACVGPRQKANFTARGV